MGWYTPKPMIRAPRRAPVVETKEDPVSPCGIITRPVKGPGEEGAVSFVPEAPINVLANSLVFKCYGGAPTFGSARVLAQKLYDRLHGASGITASGRIIRSRCIHMQQAGNEPETGYPVHIAHYQVMTH